jgi:transcriptional regulator with XRE-family HTH domain
MRQPEVVEGLAKRWGSAVAERRKAIGLTQAQLAELCAVTQQTVSQIECGRSNPHDRLKLVLANRLGIDPKVLFAWPDRAELIEAAS